MVVSDPIADMLTRIRNANQLRYVEVEMPTSKMNTNPVDKQANKSPHGPQPSPGVNVRASGQGWREQGKVEPWGLILEEI